MSWLLGLVWKIVPSAVALPLLVVLLGTCGWLTIDRNSTRSTPIAEISPGVADKLAESVPKPPVGRPTLLVLTP